MIGGNVRLRQGRTERDIGFILHALLAEQSFEEDNRADENSFLGQFGGLEVPAVKGFDRPDPRFVEHYWESAGEGDGEGALVGVRQAQAHQVAKWWLTVLWVWVYMSLRNSAYLGHARLVSLGLRGEVLATKIRTWLR